MRRRTHSTGPPTSLRARTGTLPAASNVLRLNSADVATDVYDVESTTGWFARQMMRSAVGSMTTTAVFCGALGAVATSAVAAPILADGASPATGLHVGLSLGVGLVAAVVAVSARLATALFVNPTGWLYQRRYAASDPGLRSSAEAMTSCEVATSALDQLLAVGFTRAGTLVTRDGSAIAHLATARESRVCAVVSEATGATTVHSLLTDGRVVTTADGLVAPSDHLVVQVVEGSTSAVVRSHAHILRLMFQTSLASCDPGALALRAIELERDAWRALGPITAALAHVTGRRAITRVAARVPLDSVLLQSARCRSTDHTTAVQPTTATAVQPMTATAAMAATETPPVTPVRAVPRTSNAWDDWPPVRTLHDARELEAQRA
jgi:hypothetical protein